MHIYYQITRIKRFQIIKSMISTQKTVLCWQSS